MQSLSDIGFHLLAFPECHVWTQNVVVVAAAAAVGGGDGCGCRCDRGCGGCSH